MRSPLPRQTLVIADDVAIAALSSSLRGSRPDLITEPTG
jgi:hypothetical protein